MNLDTEYLNNECVILDNLIDLIEGGDLGDYKKIVDIDIQSNERKQTRCILLISAEDKSPIKQINLLTHCVGEEIYANKKSYEFAKTKFIAGRDAAAAIGKYRKRLNKSV